eukprot:UN21627
MQLLQLEDLQSFEPCSHSSVKSSLQYNLFSMCQCYIFACDFKFSRLCCKHFNWLR